MTCPPQSHSTNATDGFPKDCSEITFGAGQNRPDAIYPYGLANKSVLVNCACTSDGIWTVIQKRFDGSVDFYRNWTDYKEGFGDVSGEFWLGNDVIHQLTTSANYTLKIVLTDWDNVTKYTIYNSFNIANEADGYRLTVGEWSGNAGNSMNVHNGKMFTTRDKDNDLYIGNCADFSIGAWWYQSCCTANLNGFYYSGPNAPESKGIVWASWHGVSYSLKATSMMIIKN